MPGKASLKILGNWKKELGVPLDDALAVSMQITGKTGEQACRQAIIFMAQSASALTKQARKRRRVKRDSRGKYVEMWNGGTMRKLYEWAYSDSNPQKLPGTFDDAKTIGNRGLGKRSWLWGLGKIKTLPARAKKPMPGVATLRVISRFRENGYELQNDLGYIEKAMPSGWSTIVSMKATNKIMAQARNKLEKRWRREMGLPRRQRKEPRADNSTLARYFMARA